MKQIEKITVYFERKGYAEIAATFPNEGAYIKNLSTLRKECKKKGFDKVTEEVN